MLEHCIFDKSLASCVLNPPPIKAGAGKVGRGEVGGGEGRRDSHICFGPHSDQD